MVPYATLVRQFHADPPGKLYCLHGGESVFRLSLAAAAQVLLNGIPVALVDGTNHFDVYYIAEFARRWGAQWNARPEDLLDNIFVSRAFTCYQMEAVVTERLPLFMAKKSAPVAIIFGLLDTFYDEQAPMFEVRAGVRRMMAALQALKEARVSVLLASADVRLASSERGSLFPQVRAIMDQSYRVEDTDGKPRIVHEPQCLTETGTL